MESIQAGKDSGLLIPPSPLTKNGADAYQIGYRNGYYMGYTRGLASKLKTNVNNELKNLIAIRLDEISDSMQKENNKNHLKK